MGILGAGASTGFVRNMSLEYGPNSRINEEYRIKEYRILGRTGFKVSDIGCGPVTISNENLLKAILNKKMVTASPFLIVRKIYLYNCYSAIYNVNELNKYLSTLF